jgi:hypothetical protein
MTVFSYIVDYIPVRKELKLRIEGNVGIVCNARDFRVDYLNETALEVFLLIDGRRTVADIIQCFLENVEVDRNVFEKDLVELLRNFQWQKLITLKRRV